VNSFQKGHKLLPVPDNLHTGMLTEENREIPLQGIMNLIEILYYSFWKFCSQKRKPHWPLTHLNLGLPIFSASISLIFLHLNRPLEVWQFYFATVLVAFAVDT